MERDRNRRYQTAFDLAEDLRRVREREPILAKPASPFTRFKKWAERDPKLAGTTAALFVALMAGLAASVYFLAQSRDALVRLYLFSGVTA